MATIKYNQNGTTYSCWSSTDRVTTPSLCFNDGGTTKYVPLFAVGNGAEGQSGDFYFRVGGLCANHNGTTYRAALERRYARTVESSVSCYISHSGATGSTTQTVQQARTVSASCGFMQTYHLNLGAQDWWYGLTFNSTPSISNGNSSLCSVSAYTDHATISPTALWLALVANTAAWNTWTVSATGYINVQQTVTTYPSEYKEAWAVGDFGYGVTYPSPPSLWLNWGDVSIGNNSGNGSFHAQCLLGGTVAYGQGTTLTRSFSVGFSGAI